MTDAKLTPLDPLLPKHNKKEEALLELINFYDDDYAVQEAGGDALRGLIEQARMVVYKCKAHTWQTIASDGHASYTAQCQRCGFVTDFLSREDG